MSKISNTVSYLLGEVAKKELPLQKYINTGYVKLFGLDMSEFSEPETYKSLSELFSRGLQQPREIDSAEFISPCDGYISEIGESSEDKAIQAKGLYYGIDELIDDTIKDALYVTIYLSPKDYHRYHAPCDMKVLKTTFIGGSLLPVNNFSVNNFKAVFTRNERAVLKCQDSRGEIFYLVFVGALNVGSISFNHVDRKSNEKNRPQKEEFLHEALTYKKGDELGAFHLGSTIIFVGDKNRFRPIVAKGSRAIFGGAFLELI